MVDVTATFSDETFALMSMFAKEQEISVQEYLSRRIAEMVEDQEDLRDAEAILADEDDKIISHEEFWRGLES